MPTIPGIDDRHEPLAHAARGAASTRRAVAAIDVELPPDRPDPSDAAQRHTMIAEMAFFIAQQRGFAPGQELDDWLAAEREVDQRLSAISH